MTPRESTYLDILRSLAAVDVVFGHAADFYDLPRGGQWGHQAVMVFFVLSGYVIAHVAAVRETSLRPFAVARLARLWSVVVPALALTVVCDVIGHRYGHEPTAYAFAPTDWPLVRIGAMLGFLSESWVSIQPLSNGAAWSLCLEFWYYALFAAWVFLPRGRLRGAALLAAAALMGHKGLLLLPVWLMGVALQRAPALRRHPAWVDGLLWAGGLGFMGWVVATRAYDPAIHAMQDAVSPWVFRQLAEARVFWLDWAFGLAVAAHLLGARRVAEWLPLRWIAAPARWCAGVSFALYMFHEPLLHLTAGFLPRDAGWLAIGLTLAVVAVIGPPAEGSKRWWRRRLDGVVAWGMGRWAEKVRAGLPAA